MANGKLLGPVLAAALAAAAAAGAMALGQPSQSAPSAGSAYGPGMMGAGRGGYGMMGGGAMMMGRGMMGHGMMMGGRGMMGCGGMGRGMMMGRRPGAGPRADLDLSVKDVTACMEHRLAVMGNPHLKLGPVTQKDADTITADVVTTDKGGLAQRLDFDRRTGVVRAEN